MRSSSSNTAVAFLAAAALGIAASAVSAGVDRDEAVRKYLESHREALSQVESGGVDYRTPQIYGSNVPDSSTGSPAPVRPTSARAVGDGGIKPFGYDMFDAPASAFFVPSEAPVPENYVLGPGDALILNLWGRVEKTYELTVDREGKVFIPRSGEVTLWGLTVSQAEAKLRDVLGRIYSDFQLGLVLGKIKSIKVYVFGAVKKPGAYTVSGLSTLFNVLYLSGGPDLHGSMRNIRLSRGGKVIRSVDLYEVLLDGKNVDIRLANNDVIFVPVAAATAAVRGRVKMPAVYELLGGERVRDVIALAGGPDPDAYLEKVTIRRIERNQRHVVLNVDLTSDDPSQDLVVADGDTIDVYAVYEATERYISLEGWVKYPGKYAYRNGMRVSDLLEDQLRMDSYLERANVVRTNRDMTKRLIAVDLRAALSGDSTANLALRERDVLKVYSVDDIRRVPLVTIEGQVERPDTYELTEQMRLSDLVFLAGGLRKNAYLLYAEIARVGANGYSNIVRTDLKKCLDNPGSEADLTLEEDDRVFIREIPEWSLHELVRIEGEIRFPGRYALASRNETLSSLVRRAGGFTENAFLRGAVFERSSIEDDIRQRNLMGIIRNLQEVSLDSSIIASQNEQMKSLERTSMKRIMVDLEALFERGDTSNDIELRDGDRIYIPRTPSGVHVLGAVASSGTIKYVDRQDYRFYLHHAGGLVKSADPDEIRIVKPDGRVFKDNLGSVDIDIGDSIVVPKKIVRERDWWKIVSSSLVIVSSAVTTAYLITNL